MEQLSELEATARAVGEKIDAIKTKERKAANQKKVGRYYKTRNSYSCPENPSDYWWLYAKCTRMDNEGFLYAFKFQTDKYGKIEIESDAHSYHMQHYDPCTKAEFDK